MYCVLGDKVLQCEVKRKDDRMSVCMVGAGAKEQRVPNNCIFLNEQEARELLKKKRRSQQEESQQVANNVQRCKELYEELFNETGIEVRTIDRQWTINMATKHIASLKKKLVDKPEMHAKNVSKAFHAAPSKNESDIKRGRSSFDKRQAPGKSTSHGGSKRGNR